MTRLANIVTATVKGEIETSVRASLLREQQAAIVADLAGVAKGKLSHEALGEVFARHIPSDYMASFWRDLQTKFEKEVTTVWLENLEGARSEIEHIVLDFEQAAMHHLADTFDPLLAHLVVDERSEQAFKSVASTSLMFATGATAWAAWFGANAAAISFGAALTGVGIPIAIAGGVLAVGAAYFMKARTRREIQQMVEQALDDMREHFIAEVLDAEVFPALEEANRQFAEDYVDRFAADMEDYFPRARMDDVVNGLDALIAGAKRHGALGVV